MGEKERIGAPKFPLEFFTSRSRKGVQIGCLSFWGCECKSAKYPGHDFLILLSFPQGIISETLNLYYIKMIWFFVLYTVYFLIWIFL